ncbi:DUF3467 domain-containing protein [Macrococcus equi]|uniref:DUF3467 domain-containing protein n=1 Tax=Macrococcus equi TaxID=3395462 RepID=UPI0039BDDA66
MSEERKVNYEEIYNHRGLERDVFFANSLGIQTSATDFVIEFETKMPDGIVNPKSVILNPMIAKELSMLLNNAVKQYEYNYGEVPIAHELRNQDIHLKEFGNEDERL